MSELTLESIQNFKGKYPKQLWYLFLAEMWERFCFYGMRGVLTVFMVEQLMMTDADANLKYGAIQAFVYAMTFVGGLFADKILGFRKSIFWGGLLMIVGSFTIAAAPQDLFYIGTSISIVGTGFFKPNISGVVGLLYRDGDNRRDAGFGLFYSGINIGAFLGGILCFGVGDAYGWHWAFILAGVAMMLGLVVFGLTKNSLGPLGFSPLLKEGQIKSNKAFTAEVLVYIGSLISIPLILMMVSNTDYTDIFMYIVGPVALLYIVFEMTRCTWDEVKKLLAAMIFILFSVLFWAFFEQSGGSLALFARNHLNDSLLGLTIDPNFVNNSSNSLFVILLSPLLGLLWLWLSPRKAEPNTVVKFGLGFLFLGLAFYIFFYDKNFVLATNMEGLESITSLGIFTVAYLVITIGELCLSPIGLSIMTKLSPKRMFGIMMGMWFLASAYGQYLAGLLGADMASTGRYKVSKVMEPDFTSSTESLIWSDTSKVIVNYSMVNVFYQSQESDTTKAVWQKADVSETSFMKLNSKGDTISWAHANLVNDGNEAVQVPQAIKQRNDVKLKIEPVANEKLEAYTNGYKQLALYAMICGAILILISPLVRKLMGEVK
ncbi:MAG: peptide MFS transporter [Flavobacteriales bacterium]